jgi:hypothetical protein
MKKKKKYNIGGELLQMGLQTGGNMLVPGLGSVASMLLGQSLEQDAMGKQIQKNMQKVNTTTNPYQFKDGGILEGSEDAAMYKGNSHQGGGIGVNEQGIPDPNTMLEVEGEEFKVNLPDKKTYIFSKSLKI